ncbi:AraC family transcriptional regulator [Sporolactobacillus sp. Y61]|uniref:AraC family transcriptional regulator n=1 Tax=Sporolactobacillus sp. Y61 TaxID=3160863 RepID=A0AAU8IIW0_9BACL
MFSSTHWPSAMTIDDIAQKVGLNNVCTFYRLFKNEMSVSPAKYRGHKLEQS